MPACMDRIFLGTGADDVEKRTAALCCGRRLTNGKENWYFEYIYKVWETAVRISENVPDGAAGIPDQLCSGRFGGNRLVVDQAFVCGGGLPGRHQNRSPDAGSYFIVHWGVHSADRRLHAILPELYVIDDDDSGWKTRHVSGKTGCGAVSGDNAATGSVAACAGCGCGNRHDRDRLASGRTSRDGCLDRRLSLFPDLRRAPDLQPVFAAASSGVLDDGNERHRGSDGGSVGLQQHAAAHLRQVDAAHRNVSVAGVCHHELSGAVSDGRAVCADGSLGRRCTDRVLFDRTGGVESGSEELYVGKHVRSF